jgi:hypothetical protein
VRLQDMREGGHQQPQALRCVLCHVYAICLKVGVPLLGFQHRSCAFRTCAMPHTPYLSSLACDSLAGCHQHTQPHSTHSAAAVPPPAINEFRFITMHSISPGGPADQHVEVKTAVPMDLRGYRVLKYNHDGAFDVGVGLFGSSQISSLGALYVTDPTLYDEPYDFSFDSVIALALLDPDGDVIEAISFGGAMTIEYPFAIGAPWTTVQVGASETAAAETSMAKCANGVWIQSTVATFGSENGASAGCPT